VTSLHPVCTEIEITRNLAIVNRSCISRRCLTVELHFWATVCKTVRPMLSDRCAVLSVCDVGALWPNRWMDQGETWHAYRPRPWPHRIRRGPSSPSPKGAQPPIFGPCPVWPNGRERWLLHGRVHVYTARIWKFATFSQTVVITSVNKAKHHIGCHRTFTHME